MYTPEEMNKHECVLVPICDMLHWWLIAYNIRAGKLYVLCSMGWQKSEVASSIRRYFQHVRQEQRWPEDIAQISQPIYADVIQQANGYDCGIFVTEFARRITEGVKLRKDIMILNHFVYSVHIKIVLFLIGRSWSWITCRYPCK
ncbi:ubiquitin-like-specific protease 1A isoform X1 [Xenia sp. Carnegie-2017]|uniref:ubiquitin-like-specific protease 1A isoform X1 n=1 Tax=Xenia sp. Carnegie-2017 TaxID=2897299 RepID=UPI001F04BBFA|nr:ubiquitin-like-specific protease 1A isoform X1 [Xenia sp. Carnegie-2017]